MASKLNLPRLVEALRTSLLSVTRCDFCALLLPDAEVGELRLTTLHNPETRGYFSDGAIIPIQDSICGKAHPTGRDRDRRLEEMRPGKCADLYTR